MGTQDHEEHADEGDGRDPDDVATDELPLDPAGPTEFGEAVDT